MITNVVGVTFNNDDGTSRARIIANMTEDDEICLERDPWNPYDSNAVKVSVVKNGRKQQIGYLARDVASEVSSMLRRGVELSIIIMGCGIWHERPYCELNISAMEDYY